MKCSTRERTLSCSLSVVVLMIKPHLKFLIDLFMYMALTHDATQATVPVFLLAGGGEAHRFAHLKSYLIQK